MSVPIPRHNPVPPRPYGSVPDQGRGLLGGRAALVAEADAFPRGGGTVAPDTPELLERKLREATTHEAGAWLAEHDGAPVAMTGFSATTAEAVQVGGVFTPEALRGRGYARAAVAQSLIDARARGTQSALLFTGDDNLAAQRAYRALGFERIGDYRISILRA